MDCSSIKAVRDLSSERQIFVAFALLSIGYFGETFRFFYGNAEGAKSNVILFNMFLKLNLLLWSYVAGFLDGDGCITVQIVRRADYVLGFQLRFTIQFTQKLSRQSHLDWLKDLLDNVGYIRVKGRGLNKVCDYTIVDEVYVKALLQHLLPFLRLKNKQASLCLRIMDKYSTKMSPSEFVELCFLVDQFALLNDSKKRKITAKTVADFFSKRSSISTKRGNKKKL